jgi:hypothetical protein
VLGLPPGGPAPDEFEAGNAGVCKMAFLRDSEGNVLILHRRCA